MVTQGKSMTWITMDEKLTHRQDARPYWVGINAAQQRLRQEGGKIAVLYQFRKKQHAGTCQIKSNMASPKNVYKKLLIS